MSGHSRWAKLKHSKGIIDAKKSNLFSKLLKLITVAAREGGDPAFNFKLRIAIEKAKKANLPKENIEKAIKRGENKETRENLTEITYEVFGPKGTVLLIEAVSDNKNRTLSNLRRILSRAECRLGETNSVLWMFERKGILKISNFSPSDLENLILQAIDLGAEDIQKENEELTIYTKPENLQKVKEGLEKQEVKIDYAEIEWFAKNLIQLDAENKEKLESLFQALDEDPDISDYYSNVE